MLVSRYGHVNPLKRVSDSRHIRGWLGLRTSLGTVAKKTVWHSMKIEAQTSGHPACSPDTPDRAVGCFSLRNVLNSSLIASHLSQTQGGLLPSALYSCIFLSKLRMRTEQAATLRCAYLSLETTLHVPHELRYIFQVSVQFLWVFGGTTFIVRNLQFTKAC